MYMGTAKEIAELYISVESRQSVKKQRQDELQQIVIDVLRRHPKLAYYQVWSWIGRDIGSILLGLLNYSNGLFRVSTTFARASSSSLERKLPHWQQSHWPCSFSGIACWIT